MPQNTIQTKAVEHIRAVPGGSRQPQSSFTDDLGFCVSYPPIDPPCKSSPVHQATHLCPSDSLPRFPLSGSPGTSLFSALALCPGLRASVYNQNHHHLLFSMKDKTDGESVLPTFTKTVTPTTNKERCQIKYKTSRFIATSMNFKARMESPPMPETKENSKPEQWAGANTKWPSEIWELEKIDPYPWGRRRQGNRPCAQRGEEWSFCSELSLGELVLQDNENKATTTQALTKVGKSPQAMSEKGDTYGKSELYICSKCYLGPQSSAPHQVQDPEDNKYNKAYPGLGKSPRLQQRWPRNQNLPDGKQHFLEMSSG